MTYDGHTTIWQLNGQAASHSVPREETIGLPIAFISDDEIVVHGFSDATQTFNVGTRKMSVITGASHDLTQDMAVVSPDHRLLATSGSDHPRVSPCGLTCMDAVFGTHSCMRTAARSEVMGWCREAPC